MEDRTLLKLLHDIRDTAAGGVSDAELLARFAAAGDEAAFELLVRRYQRLVFGVCRRVLRDHHDAEDAFQATFLALARKAGSLRRREAVAGWLFRVAYRAALTARAGRAAHEQSPAAVEAIASDDPAATAEQREAWAAVDEEVSRLPERFRAAAVLCYLEGKTVDEAARLLGCPRGTVASRLARARARLHMRLTRRGVGLTVGAPAAADALIRPTVRAAVLFASGKAAGQGVSRQAVLLAKKVVWAMFVKKLTTGATVLAALAGVLLLGGGLSVWLRAKAEAAPPTAQAAAPKGPEKEAAATAVTVSRPVRRELTPSEDFMGRVEQGAGSPPVAARVTGRLRDVPIKQEAKVKRGDLLFEIDPAPFKEALAKAEANRDAAAGPERRAAEAAVELARQNLQATRILAPVDGTLMFEGSIRPGDQVSGTWEHPAILAIVAYSDQTGFRFDMDERAFLRYRRLLAAREAPGVGGPLAVGLADEGDFPHEAILTYFGDHFNPDTGTIKVYGVFPDPGHLLLEGMLARVRVPFGKPYQLLEVSEAAIVTDGRKDYAWVANDRNIVERRDVVLGPHEDGMILVREGLGPDDWVVVAGGANLHAGDKVELCRAAMPGTKAAPRP